MIPDPVDWVVDGIGGAVTGVAADAAEMVLTGVTDWVLQAVVWVISGVMSFFVDAVDPNVQADWFVGADGPYATTAAIGATLLVGFLLVGVAQGVLAGDVAGMLRRMALDLPMAVLGMVGLVTVTQLLVRLVDELSVGFLGGVGADVEHLATAAGSLTSLGGATTSTFAVLVLGVVAVVAGLILVAELVVRSALIYLVVALAPLVLAAQLWPALRGTGRRVLELLVALVVSKLVMAVALAVGTAALVGTGSGGEVTGIPTPEVAAEDPGGSVTQAVGVLLAAVAAFGVAAFSPLLVVKLLPITEAALVASGVRGAPVRAGQQALSMASYSRIAGGASVARVAAGRHAAGGVPAGAAGGGGGSAPRSTSSTSGRSAAGVATAVRPPSSPSAPPASPPPRGAAGPGDRPAGGRRPAGGPQAGGARPQRRGPGGPGGEGEDRGRR